MKLWAISALALIAGCKGQPVAGPVNQVAESPADRVAESSEVARPEPAAPVRASVFTELDASRCKLVEENRDEGPYWRRRCPGPAGYSVDWIESDLRQDLELIAANGERTDLRLSDLVANGAFSRLGPRIEWRGMSASDPDRLVVRMFVADGDEPSKPDRSLLAVARLRPSICLTGIVPPGGEQNVEARRIADSRAGPCLDR